MASYKTYIGIGKVYVPNTLVGINNFTLSRKVNLNYGASWDASQYPFYGTASIKAHEFVPDDRGYHTMKFTLTSADIPETHIAGGTVIQARFTGASVALCDTTPTEANIESFTYTSAENKIVTDNHAGETQYFAAKFEWSNPRNEDKYTLYWAFKVEMPTLTSIPRITFTHDTEYRLTESGSTPISMIVQNPNSYTLTGKFDTDPTYTLSTNLTTATVNYNFTADDIGNKIYTIEIKGAEAAADNTIYYWYDETAKYHAVNSFYTYIGSVEDQIVEYKYREVYIENTIIEYPISIVDNLNIFVLNSATIASVRDNTDHTAAMFYLTETGAIALTYNFKYTAAGANTYNIKLYDASRQNGTTFINYNLNSSNPGTFSNTIYSDTLTKVETVHLMLEITDKYKRILKKDFGVISIRAYDRPKISYFDAYFSNSNGAMNTQSTHASILANFYYTPLDGQNPITQSLEVVNNSTGAVIGKINPALTAGVRKYISNLTLPLGATFTLTYTITDRIGNSASASFVLDRSGNVLMDFNNTGYGMAIGKLSEKNALEINLPTIFYNTVDYIDGNRQTSDAASVLGYMDTYNTGYTNLQDVLDYIIAKIK